MPAIMGDAAIAFGRKEEHLRFPAIGCERPAVAESDWLTRSSVLIVDLVPSLVVRVLMVFWIIWRRNGPGFSARVPWQFALLPATTRSLRRFEYPKTIK